MTTEERLKQLEQSVENIKKQIQNINKVVMEAVRITTILEKAARLIAPPESPKTIIVEEPPQPVEVSAPIIESVIEEPTSESVQLVSLLKSDAWPAAIDPEWIADENSEQDQEDKAEGILDMIIDIHLENLKFLDFGCGAGHVINKCRTQNPKLAIGYDIIHSSKWDQFEKTNNVIYTDNWQSVKNSGPYNVVLLYDVIDHMIISDEELTNKLKEIKSLLAPNGKVYVRCHPWCSRHGTHLYRQINKAYVHMVFSDEELKSMGYTQENVRRFKHPTVDYVNLWNNAGFKVINGPHYLKVGVEQFFKETPLIKEKIQEHYKDSIWEVLRSGAFPEDNLVNQFIDFVIQ